MLFFLILTPAVQVNLVDTSQLKSQTITPAVNYLVRNYNATIGLVHESPDSVVCNNTYWIYSDNFLVELVFENACDPQNVTFADICRNISATTEYWLTTQPDLSNQYQVLNNSNVFPFNNSENFIIGYSHGATITSTVNNQTYNPEDYAKNHADIAFLEAIAYHNKRDNESANRVYEEGAATWDGFGFKDEAYEDTYTYATYKNALYILASDILGHSYNSDVYSTLLGCQLHGGVDEGGFATSYFENGTTASGSNTETTALAILALSYSPPSTPTPTLSPLPLSPNPLWLLIAIVIVATGIVAFYFMELRKKTQKTQRI